MTSEELKESSSQSNYLDDRFSTTNISEFQRMFGHLWMSNGGEATTKEHCLRMNLKPGMKVLDIGCGVGGPARYMARQYGCVVHGIDRSTTMISIAKNGLNLEGENVKKRVTFENCDILKANYPDNEFDVICSTNVIFYIDDKEYLFSKIQSWLKTGGTLFIITFMKGQQKDVSEEYVEYIKMTNFQLTTFSECENALQKSGFTKVEPLDMSEMLLRVFEEELKYFIAAKEAFILDFNKEDYDYFFKLWNCEINLVKVEHLFWGLFICKK